jgi:hypothetical protein
MEFLTQKGGRRGRAAALAGRAVIFGIFLAAAASSACADGLFPAKPTAAITAIDPDSGLIAAKETASGRTFVFKLTNPLLLKSLQVGQELFVNMPNKWVSVDGDRINGNIVPGGAAPTAAESEEEEQPEAAADNAAPAAKAKGKAAGSKNAQKKPGAGDASPPAAEEDTAAPAGEDAQDASPSGEEAAPADAEPGAQPASPLDSIKAMGQNDETEPVAPANEAPAAMRFVSAAAITRIDASSGLITARENRTGRIFQFRLANARLLHSLRVGQPLSADFASQQFALPLNGQQIRGKIMGASPAEEPQ